jgi:hypothetical protein
MISGWLLYSKPDMHAEQAQKQFATFRTAQEIGGKLQGVSGPSQKRYIKYFEQLRRISKERQIPFRNAFDILATTPPAEIVKLTLNNIITINGKKGNRKVNQIKYIQII